MLVRLVNLPLPVLEDLSEALLDFATGEHLQVSKLLRLIID
ncbi:hypothetical protein [Microcoleus sp. herbarium7]